jgi:hypothetical protein
MTRALSFTFALSLLTLAGCGGVEPTIVERAFCVEGSRDVFIVRLPDGLDSADLYVRVDTIAEDTAFDPLFDVYELVDEGTGFREDIVRGPPLRGTINDNEPCSFPPPGGGLVCLETQPEVSINTDVVIDITARDCGDDVNGRIGFSIEASLDASPTELEYLGFE